MKIAMYGSGAAGSVFASYLKKGGADMILIDRYEAHMKKVAEDGMHFTIHQEENGAYTDYNYQLKASAPTPALPQRQRPRVRSMSSST